MLAAIRPVWVWLRIQICEFALGKGKGLDMGLRVRVRAEVRTVLILPEDDRIPDGFFKLSPPKCRCMRLQMHMVSTYSGSRER